MEFEIRRARTEDIEKLVSLQQKLVYDQISRDPYLPEGFNMPTVHREYIEANLNNDRYAIFVGLIDGEVVGVIEVCIQNKDYYFFMDDYGYIVNMYVDESKRVYRLSNNLRAKAEAWAKEKGMKYVQFDVFEHNTNLLKRTECLGYKSYRHRVVKEL